MPRARSPRLASLTARLTATAWAAALTLSLTASRLLACDIALVLAMDVSGSVDAYEYGLQTQGIALALHDPAITEALLSGRVALSLLQWSGAEEQSVALPWQRLHEPADIRAASARIATLPRAFAGGNTAVGAAIAAASDLFNQTPDCRNWVIDVSGDGDENDGNTVGHERRAAHRRGIVINGLAIEGMGTAEAISNFYRRWVITPGGFVITAQQHRDFARAIRVKLLRELIAPMALNPAARPTPQPAQTLQLATQLTPLPEISVPTVAP
ncbi:DUF1194 domain-containing protein [Pararhodobacter oceanensis]|uniref:DUF1194 domain-containing protein n=1 Tax=Pararhodobacter oceanensis TaxID=2172121 RepID=UPI003A8F8D75